MSSQGVLVQLPGDLLEAVHRAANERNRSVEELIIESIALLYKKAEALPSDDELVEYTDEQLWAVVHHQIAWAEQARMRALISEGKNRALTEDERKEILRLRDVLDDYMLVRSKALALLNERGHDTASFFQPRS